MGKTLNLELFKPGFIFSFKGNKHLVIKDYQVEVLVINLDWNKCEVFEVLSGGDYIYKILSDHDGDKIEELVNDLDSSLYKLSYLDILEDILHSNTLRGEKVDTTLLIEEDNDNTNSSYS